MKIGVTSQNFRTVTGHAGKARRFLLYERDASGNPMESGRLDLPKDQSMHEFRGQDHPTDGLDVIITGGCGQGFISRMFSRGIRVIPTAETDPVAAVRAVLAGDPLPPPEPHEH